MAYGAILGQLPPESGMSAQIILNLTSGDYTSLTVTSPSGKQYTGSIIDGFWTVTGITEYGNHNVVAQGSTPYNGSVNVVSCQQYYFPSANPVLNDNTWEQISFISENGLASSFWAIGDAKQITINGIIGQKTYTNYKPWVYILGFNHNAEREGSNLIHFGCFREGQLATTNNSIALDDNSYNTQTSSIAYNMNSSNTNSGGWSSSRMRTTIIDADATSPSSASSNSFLVALSSDLKAVLKRCTKYTDNTGGGTGSVQSNVTPTQDWAFLLSEYEVFGSITHSNSFEANYQQQYQYYVDGNSKVKYRQSSTSNAAIWWERSPSASDSTDFCNVNTGGTASSYSASVSRGFAPGFCV